MYRVPASQINDERIEKLLSIDQWSGGRPRVDWEQRFQELKQHKSKYGGCNVPQRFKNNPQLGAYVI